MLNQFFRLSSHGSNIRTEIIAGITTFLTMSYIIFVNPQILGDAGMNKEAVFVATCIAAAIGSIIMGLLANYPVGMAPGMGLNAFFAYGVVGAMGYTWQQALGAVFISGIIFLVLTATGARRWLIDGIPSSLRCAIAAGIGLFLAIVALQSSGIVVANSATLIALGDVTSHPALYAILGFFIIATLDALKIKGSILIGILSITILSALKGHSNLNGFISMPPSLVSTFLQLDLSFLSFNLGDSFTKLNEGINNGGLWSGLKVIIGGGIIHIILTFVLVEIFDATGTLMAVAKRANLLTPEHIPRLNKALFADSTAILAGSLIGTSSTTAYVESAAGVEAGGRTGLTAVVVGILFIAALFFAPIASAVPSYATAPALIYVAGLMLREMVDIKWDYLTEALPAGLCVLIMPFTYSIANGIAFGFIAYVVLKLSTGRFRDIHPATAIVAALFILKFAL
ncbi:adenine permease [Gammaproteobacteria bacterium]|nr:adenine permease [Gammaproteobacteria bacterium]